VSVFVLVLVLVFVFVLVNVLGPRKQEEAVRKPVRAGATSHIMQNQTQHAFEDFESSNLRNTQYMWKLAEAMRKQMLRGNMH
jgi:hypothetical protein